MIAAAIVVLLALTTAPAPGGDEETRVFSGEGSIGTGSDLEVYLPPGEYRHELIGDCEIAASLFPADRLPAVPLGDVLQADLATAPDRRIDRGDVVITRGGWANLQVGTGPECTWEYRITGAFLPLGEEPPPPRPPDDVGGLWGIGVVVVLVVAILLSVRRSRQSSPGAADDGDVDDEPKVRIGPA